MEKKTYAIKLHNNYVEITNSENTESLNDELGMATD